MKIKYYLVDNFMTADPDDRRVQVTGYEAVTETELFDYINHYRINEFKIRIQQTTSSRYTLSALSEQCGFSSRTSFFRALKKQTGQTPLEFLKSINKENMVDMSE